MGDGCFDQELLTQLTAPDQIDGTQLALGRRVKTWFVVLIDEQARFAIGAHAGHEFCVEPQHFSFRPGSGQPAEWKKTCH